jgi:hypothetical protein
MHNPDQPDITLPALSDKALEALSYIIVTATEGGHYTSEDFSCWKKYKHGDSFSVTTDGNGQKISSSYFRAEVTVSPSPDAHPENAQLPDIRLTPEELGRRLFLRLLDPKITGHHRALIARLIAGDEDAAGEADVIDSGALLQIAVYGEVVFG